MFIKFSLFSLKAKLFNKAAGASFPLESQREQYIPKTLAHCCFQKSSEIFEKFLEKKFTVIGSRTRIFYKIDSKKFVELTRKHRY